MKKTSTFLVLIFIVSIFSMKLQAQDNRPMHEIHSMFVANFMRYVQWPDEKDPGEFVIGVLGDEEVFNTLKTWNDGKPRGAKKIVVKKLASANDAASCSIVYLGKDKNKEFESIKTSTAGKSVMTITNGFNLGQKGSCFNFKEVAGKLKFEMNQQAVNTAQLKVSSQLSSMAIII